jgi:hypothetical protein
MHTGSRARPATPRPFQGICGVFCNRAIMRLAKAVEKEFFFKKKNQKTFVTGTRFVTRRAPTGKSFCFFFQKEALPSYDLINASKSALI